MIQKLRRALAAMFSRSSKSRVHSSADQETSGEASLTPESNKTWKLDVEFGSVSGAGEPFIAAVVGEMEARNWSPTELFHVQLALEEAFANAIEHGNRFQPEKLVRARCELDNDRLFVSVQDEGSGFSEMEVADPTDVGNLEKPTGRGLFLIRNFMTSVSHNDAGNCIYLEKMRANDESEAPL